MHYSSEGETRDGKDMITTYAMLGNCSQGSFIHDNLVKEFGVHGMKTTLNIKTLHEEKTESTMIVEGILVTGMSGNSSLLSKKLTKKLQPQLKARTGSM